MKKIDKTKVDIYTIADKFIKLRDRIEHPEGNFDKAGRWYPDEYCSYCDNIREPSRAYPYTYMVHARTIKHLSSINDISEKNIRQYSKLIDKGLVTIHLFAPDTTTTRENKITAPAGWEFAIDENGLCIRKIKEKYVNYHFNVISKKLIKEFITEALENAEKLKQENNFKIQANKYIPITYVFRSDAYRAGNCEIGTENLIRRLKLSGIFVKTDFLHKITAKEDSYTKKRIEASISSARKRELQALKRGYSILSEVA